VIRRALVRPLSILAEELDALDADGEIGALERLRALAGG
jgi:hypothetical protein